MPPPGWVISPDLTEIYGRTIIVRKGSISRVRREIRAAERATKKDRSLSRQGGMQMILGGLLMGAGLMGRRLRR